MNLYIGNKLLLVSFILSLIAVCFNLGAIQGKSWKNLSKPIGKKGIFNLTLNRNLFKNN